MENYNKELEKHLIEMAKQKEEADKKMLSLEIVVGMLSVIILLSLSFLAAYAQMADWVRVLVVVFAFVVCMIGIGFALKIEQIAGYYECAKCHHRYVPSFMSVFWAMHMGRTRYMRCPKCGKRSWNKKKISKE